MIVEMLFAVHLTEFIEIIKGKKGLSRTKIMRDIMTVYIFKLS